MGTKTYSQREVERILSNNGWFFQRRRGSHKIYTNKNGQHITIRYRNQNKMIMRRLIKEYDMVVEGK